QFRKALAYAIDKQQLADTLALGFSPVADSIIAPDQAQYPYIEKSIVKYEYDPRKSIQILDSLGFARGPDGMYRDRAGERLAPIIQTTINDTSSKTTFATVDYWQRVGIAAEATILSPQGV